MITNFSIDSYEPLAYIKICNYLFSELQPIILENRPIIFICIGTDRSTGDSLGPLIGYKLKHICKGKMYIYGSLENPIHAKNLCNILDKINSTFKEPYIVAIDSCLGKIDHIGKIYINKKPLTPGLALNKNLPSVGNMSILGIVNIASNFEFLVLQNTRLYMVMQLADIISKGIYHFSLKYNKENISYNLMDIQ